MKILFLLLSLYPAGAAPDRFSLAVVEKLTTKLGPLVRECKGLAKTTPVRLGKVRNATQESIDPRPVLAALKKNLGLHFVDRAAAAQLDPQVSAITLERGASRATAYTLTLTLSKKGKKICEKAFSDTVETTLEPRIH